MKILLDAIPLQGLMTGISRYLRNLYTELERLPGVTVYYTDSRSCTTKMPVQAAPGPWMKATSLVWKLPDSLAFGFRAATWLAYEMRIRRLIRRNAFTLYHETAFTPAAVKTIPQVLTLHDLSLVKFKEMHPNERVWFMQLFFHRRMRYTQHIITVSEFTRSQICAELHLPSHKVTAIHEAPDPFFSKRERESVRRTLHQLGLPNDYLLFVGTLEPRKNLSLLIQAAGVCKTDIPIVLAGWKGWDDEAWSDMAKNQGVQNRIITTGYVDEETLACLYSAATALVFPSFYEGFGLPVLEAMACQCPVICSNAASLPEVAGDAALLIDPCSVEELASAMDKVVEDGTVRNSLIRKGVKRAAQFSWTTAAEKTLDVFRSVAGHDSP
ncbi:MAG: glycosyltransferase family 4 protein [Thermodesulfobacteriota bacterium]